nr:hypothetical protein [Brevibacillus laterosporus]
MIKKILCIISMMSLLLASCDKEMIKEPPSPQPLTDGKITMGNYDQIELLEISIRKANVIAGKKLNALDFRVPFKAKKQLRKADLSKYQIVLHFSEKQKSVLQYENIILNSGTTLDKSQNIYSADLVVAGDHLTEKALDTFISENEKILVRVNFDGKMQYEKEMDPKIQDDN